MSEAAPSTVVEPIAADGSKATPAPATTGVTAVTGGAPGHPVREWIDTLLMAAGMAKGKKKDASSGDGDNDSRDATTTSTTVHDEAKKSTGDQGTAGAPSSTPASRQETTETKSDGEGASSAEDEFRRYRRRRCEVPGCTKFARFNNACSGHGGRRLCSQSGCMRVAQFGHKCSAHGGIKYCSVEGCERAVQSRGFCKTHGGGVRCKHPGCDKGAISKGHCRAHGGGSRCAAEGCEKWAQRLGFCVRHSKASTPPSEPQSKHPTTLESAQVSALPWIDNMAVIGGTEPVFLKGYASECVADDATLSRFSPADVASLEAFARHKDTVVELACKPKNGRCYSGDHRARQSVSVKFGEFLAYFRAAYEGSEHWLATVEDLEFYLCQCPIAVHKPDETCSDAVLPRAYELLKIPNALPSVMLTQINLWMTVHASQTSLHYDAYRNVLVVLHGQKTVTLYPPSDCGDLRANPVYSASANHSPVDVHRLKLGEAPSTQGQTFCVGAGDALYIPEGWWHHVESDPFTIAVNFWFGGLRDTITRDSRMTTYYIRVAMQALLAQQIATTVTALHASAKSSHPTSEISCADIAAEVSQAGKELAMLSFEGKEFLAVQSSMATQLPQVWRSMLHHASIDFAGALAHCWESFSFEEELLAVIFSSLGEEEDEIKQQLLVKQEAFHHKIFKRVVATTLG